MSEDHFRDALAGSHRLDEVAHHAVPPVGITEVIAADDLAVQYVSCIAIKSPSSYVAIWPVELRHRVRIMGR